MNVITQYDLLTDPNNIRFLRENSYWYKYLNRSNLYLKDFKEALKVKYKLTPKDKLDRFSKNIDRISQIIDIFS